MAQGMQQPDHVWLVMIKAMSALTRYAAAGIEDTGLGDSDFRVLEVLLHKGPLPVNTIGPIVDLTPGSISIAVERLVEKGFVSRVESTKDRRVRIVALTRGGRDLIVPAFRKHAGQMRRVFSEQAATIVLPDSSGISPSEAVRRRPLERGTFVSPRELRGSL